MSKNAIISAKTLALSLSFAGLAEEVYGSEGCS